MFLPLFLPCLYLLIFHPIVVACLCSSNASTRCGVSSINITWPFTTDPQCKGAHLVHCNGSTPAIQFDGNGVPYIIERIDGNVLTVQDPDPYIRTILQESNCSFLYEFIKPYPLIDPAHFVHFLASQYGSTFFNCSPREYDFSRDIFYVLNDSTPCEGYNLSYFNRVENRPIESKHPASNSFCKHSSAPHIEWKLSFEEGNDRLSVLSVGFSKQGGLHSDCFNCHCTSDTVVGDDGCGCSDICPAAHGIPRKKRQIHVAILVAVSLAVIILCSLVLLTWIRCKHRWTKLSVEKTTLPFGIDRLINLRESEKAFMSPLYPLYSIIQATNNFSNENKLGEGGFGPVYKGKFIDGQEIAVKRLATKSGQGREEFENEIILIAKLQHRNLVKLLGYCIDGEEKILIYEYMPNKSLDYFLYDTTRRAQLDWSRRLHIIEGISQGLLYLHKHSRLKIIHRDLKASNILLDVDMNPKISDFGLARIFGTNETEANTNRIVVVTCPRSMQQRVFSPSSLMFLAMECYYLRLSVAVRTTSIIEMATLLTSSYMHGNYGRRQNC